MQRVMWERAGAVAVVAGVMVIASQVLASVDPAYEQRRGRDDEVEVEVADGETSTSVTDTTAAPAGVAPTTTTTEALPPITGPARLIETSQFDGRGVGPVEAGMTVAEAEQAAGRRFTISERDDPADRCFVAAPEGLVGLRFVVQGPAPVARDGRIVRAEADSASWTTVSGARVGQAAAEIRRIYGRRAVDTDGVLTVPVKDGGRSFAVGFVMSERQVVTAIRSGVATAVAQTDGCT